MLIISNFEDKEEMATILIYSLSVIFLLHAYICFLQNGVHSLYIVLWLVSFTDCIRSILSRHWIFFLSGCMSVRHMNIQYI